MLRNLLRSTIYVRLKPERLSVLHVESGREVSDVPALAIERKNGKAAVVAMGHEASVKAGQPDITVTNGFKHPRMVIADFTVAQETLKHFLKKVIAGSIFIPSPVIVMHPLVTLEGGLSQLEIRALAELSMGAGGHKVYVWTGPELSKDELGELRFSRAGGRLLYPEIGG